MRSPPRYGGENFADYADGVIKPIIGLDYAPTGIWETSFGHEISPTGDAEVARSLIEAANEVPAELRYSYPVTPTNERVANVVVESLAKAGLTVEKDGIEPSCGYGCGLFPRQLGDFGAGGWGHDWPNASTVIPALFTEAGGWDQSHVDDAAFDEAIEQARGTLDRADQARQWQALNRRAVEEAWIIPTFWSRDYRLAGTKVGPIYEWPAYSSWPYAEMYVTP